MNITNAKLADLYNDMIAVFQHHGVKPNESIHVCLAFATDTIRASGGATLDEALDEVVERARHAQRNAVEAANQTTVTE